MRHCVRSRVVPSALVLGMLGAALHHLGRTYGSTRAERGTTLVGDHVICEPDVVCTHAITIDAPPGRVWPWLLQVGWHRGGWYTARWVDRLLFPDNWASADRLIPGLGHLAIGDFIPDGAPQTGCGFVVMDIEPERHLLLRSTTHMPVSWRRRGIASLEWTWVFVLVPRDGGAQTRFLFRWRAHTHPWWFTMVSHSLVVPADFLMSRDMMRGIRRRAEGVVRRSAADRGPTMTA